MNVLALVLIAGLLAVAGSVCTGECAKAWPPVLTEGEPAAGKAVRSARIIK